MRAHEDMTVVRYGGKDYVPTDNYFSEDENDSWIVFHKGEVVQVFATMKEAAAKMKELRGGSTKYFMRPYRVLST